MGSVNTQTFQYNGHRYNFTVIVSYDPTDPKKSFALDNSHIDSFYYVNEINSLFLHGYVEYTDTRGEVDKILDLQFAFCEINFDEIEVKSDRDYVVEIPQCHRKLYHKFYINSVDVLDRHENEIKYRFNLVSRDVLKGISKVQYSNYGKDKEDIVDIIKNILKFSDFEYNPDTFDIVKSGVKLNYLTDVNDNMITSIGYLLNKMYFYHDKIPLLLFIIYNEHTDKYEMFDVMNPLTWFNAYEIPVTFYKNQIELFTTAEGINFATVTKFPRLKQHDMISNAKYYDYLIENNYITDEFIGNKTIQKMYGTFYNTGEYGVNLAGLYKNINHEFIYNRHSSYWNNTNKNLDINLYNEMIANFTQGNSLIVNTEGNILRKPGCIMNISIDRDVKNDTGDDGVDDTQSFLSQYRAYEGRWFVTKVLNFLNLRQMRYTLNIICSRNFLLQQGCSSS